MTKLLLFVALGSFSGTDEIPLPANKGFQIPAGEIEARKEQALIGSGLAAFQLYNYYDVVLLDRKTSFYWATISAENDYPPGMYALGFRLAEEKDRGSLTRARFWLEKAADRGEPLARSVLKQLNDRAITR